VKVQDSLITKTTSSGDVIPSSADAAVTSLMTLSQPWSLQTAGDVQSLSHSTGYLLPVNDQYQSHPHHYRHHHRQQQQQHHGESAGLNLASFATAHLQPYSSLLHHQRQLHHHYHHQSHHSRHHGEHHQQQQQVKMSLNSAAALFWSRDDNMAASFADATSSFTTHGKFEV